MSTFICVAGKGAVGRREHHPWGTGRAVGGQGSAGLRCLLCAWLAAREDGVQQRSSGVDQVSPVLSGALCFPPAVPSRGCLCVSPLATGSLLFLPFCRAGAGGGGLGLLYSPLTCILLVCMERPSGNSCLACRGALGQEWDLCSLSGCG